jgi:hypothetical protein
LICYCLLKYLKFLNVFRVLSSSREGDSSSDCQDIARTLWNLNVHYCLYKCPPIFPTPSQIDLVHARPSFFLKIYFDITLTSTRRSSTLFRFRQQNPVCIRTTCPMCHTHHMPCPSILFGYIYLIRSKIRVISICLKRVNVTKVSPVKERNK